MSDAVINVEKTDNPPATIVAPQGNVDMSTSPELRQALRSALDSSPARLIVDLSDVSYMDSSGLATLVEAMRTAKSSPRIPMVLCGLNDTVRAIFEIARLHQFFEIAPSRDDAMQTA
ncbi:MAG: STAS domain-containing protein [Planctomycetota bacterium]